MEASEVLSVRKEREKRRKHDVPIFQGQLRRRLNPASSDGDIEVVREERNLVVVLDELGEHGSYRREGRGDKGSVSEGRRREVTGGREGKHARGRGKGEKEKD